MTFTILLALALQIDEEELGLGSNRYWDQSDFFQPLLCTVREFFQRPIWSAGLIELSDELKITPEQLSRVVKVAISTWECFDQLCHEESERRGMTLPYMHMYLDSITACWKEILHATNVFTEIVEQDAVRLQDQVGLCALATKCITLFQRFIYKFFLSGSAGVGNQAVRCMLPVAHAALFQEDALAEAQEQGEDHPVIDVGPPVLSKFSLHVAAAEQRPTVHDVIYLPAVNTA